MILPGLARQRIGLLKKRSSVGPQDLSDEKVRCRMDDQRGSFFVLQRSSCEFVAICLTASFFLFFLFP